jgi:hypothetical protein
MSMLLWHPFCVLPTPSIEFRVKLAYALTLPSPRSLPLL